MTVGPGIPELGSDDGAVDGQVVDVTGGKVRAAAELVVPPAQGRRQLMQLQLVAVGVRRLLQDGEVLAGHLVVVGVGIVVHVDHHHPGAHEAGVEVHVGIRDVTALDPRQPDDLAQPQVGLELRLHLRLGEAGVAVAVDPAALGHDGGAVAIHLDAAPLTDELALQVIGIGLPAHQGGDPGVMAVLLLVTPAVEVEVHQPEPSLLVLHEDAAGIPQPDVIHLGVDEVGVALAAQLARQRLVILMAEHVDPGVGHHGLHQPPYGGLHLLVVATPDLAGGPEGHPHQGLGGGLLRHVVASGGAGFAGGEGRAGTGQTAKPGNGAKGNQLFQYVASGKHRSTPGFRGCS